MDDRLSRAGLFGMVSFFSFDVSDSGVAGADDTGDDDLVADGDFAFTELIWKKQQ